MKSTLAIPRFQQAIPLGFRFSQQQRPTAPQGSLQPCPYPHRNPKQQRARCEIRLDGADGASLHAGEQLFRLRLNDNESADQIKRLLSRTALPALLGCFLFVFDDGIESILPGSR